MEAISEVLRIVKLRGALFFNAEFSAPWCVASLNRAKLLRCSAPERVT